MPDDAINTFIRDIPTGILIFFVFMAFFIGQRYAGRYRSKAAKAALDKTAEGINELRKQVIAVSSSCIPGKEIKTVYGHVSGTSLIEVTTPEEADVAEKAAMLNLMQNAKAMGANAVIDVKMSNSNHRQQGHKGMVSKTYYTGTAVGV